MATTLKPHWITTIEQIADAGKNGILTADLDKRAADALVRRGLAAADTKLQYRGVDAAPVEVPAYFLTDAGLAWLVEHRETPTASRALPAGWVKKEAGRYLHTESGVEIHRDGADWGVLIPMAFPGRGFYIAAVASCNTRAAALTAAAERIPAVLAMIDTAWGEALFDRVGRPETWTPGQISEETVYERHDAVRYSQTRTGWDAQQDERIVHLELGTRATYHHSETGCSYVVFDGETGPELVHPDDVIVISERGPAPVLTMQVTREPEHAGYTELGGPDEPGEDYYLLVDGQRIGGTYWCGADNVEDGKRWASYGPAGLSLGHHDRESAEQTQVREYAINPDLTDRQRADDTREAQAARARLTAARAADAEACRREREGDDAPGEPVWVLPAHHALFGTLEDVTAVKAWLDAHDLEDVAADHEIRVERRADRQAIVVRQLRPGSRIQTRVVTCRQAPPAVDTTPRPGLTDLIEKGHTPTRFPLIDFGQEMACSACTKEHGSPTEIVSWPCPVFEKTRTVGAAEIIWKEAESAAITADAALRIAETLGRDTTPEKNMLRSADIHHARARIALSAARRDPEQHADVRFVMVTKSSDDGGTWTPIHWVGFTRQPGETASGQALRYAGHHHLIPGDSWYLDENPGLYRVEVYSDPMAAEPDGVWTNLVDPCPTGRHTIGSHPVASGPARPDGARVETVRCARCLHRVWRLVPAAGPAGRWTLIGYPLPSPSPSARRDHSDSDPRQDSDSDPARVQTVTDRPTGPSPSTGPGPSPSPASFGYRIETRTGRRWRTVRMGNTPPLYRPDPDGLWAAADTILGNARPVLGLGDKDPLPRVRVLTWHTQSGATHLVARHLGGKVNSRAF